ncbi:class I SAM-dependent methyltransferase [Sanguibacter antarcticus]|nr:class I SAM-dependent methyltransferase [Sanguibacter antarcticus]
MTTAEQWDAEAASFDDQPDHGLRDAAVRTAWADLLLPLMPPAPARIADIGCGTGTLSLLLSDAGHRVSGLDISPAMVALATTKVARAGYEPDVRGGDAAAPPWHPGSFDVVLTRHVLWAMDDPDAALARWIELLAPHGRLVLIEGRWSTGAGLSAARVCGLVRRYRAEADVTVLDDARYWGAPVSDERYVVVSRS